MATKTVDGVGVTLGQGRESRLWCMLVVELLDEGAATMGEAVAAAAGLVKDERSPIVTIVAGDAKPKRST